MFDPELEDMKTKIDLRQYAASQGYEKDSKLSRGNCWVMRRTADDDKIAIKVDDDGHYVYCSNRDDRDHGSILDFVIHRHRLTLGAARMELRPWLGKPPVSVPEFAPLPRTKKDRVKLEDAYFRMRDAINGHPYLERERSIPTSLLALGRFAGRIRIDNRSNAVFPHFDQDRLSGYELKNTGFTGFASGGTKGLWISHTQPDDNRLVFCESAIDALSHAVLFPDDRARYASIGGKLNPRQPELIRDAIARMPANSEIIAAMDADADGAKLAAVIRQAVELVGREDLRFTLQEPFGFKDWNDQLRARPTYSFPTGRPDVPSVA
jgi:hypothetical protein